MKKIIVILILLFLFGVKNVSAIGVGVKPKEIDISARMGKKIETKILIVNPDSEPYFYHVYPDSLADKITINPADFRLEPNGSQTVAVAAKFWMPGMINTVISVVGKPLNQTGMPVSAGVKIPISISVLWPAIVDKKLYLIIFGICSIFIIMIILRQIKYKKL